MTTTTINERLRQFAELTLDARGKTSEANEAKKEAAKLKGDGDEPGTLLHHFLEEEQSSIQLDRPMATVHLHRDRRARVVAADEEEGTTTEDKVKLVEALIAEGLGELVTINYQSATSYLKKLYEEEGATLEDKHPDLVGLLGVETTFDLRVRKRAES